MSVYDRPECAWNDGAVRPEAPGLYFRKQTPTSTQQLALFDGAQWFHAIRSGGEERIYETPHRHQNIAWRAPLKRGKGRLPAIGEKFGMLAFLENIGYEAASRRWIAKFRCECGNEKAMNLYEVRDGRHRSCGCLRDSEERVAKWRQSYRDNYHKVEAAMAERNIKVGLKNRGSSKPLGPAAAWEFNATARYWKLMHPSGVILEGWNLANMIRNNAELFSPDDLIWRRNACRATKGLGRLHEKKDGRPVAQQWRGWISLDDNGRIKNEC